MDRSFPAYYHNFHCLAGACPDSCCQEWTVDVDDASAVAYRMLPGPLGERLRQVLQDTDSGTVMTIENDRCPMWRQDGLCEIQARLGHDALCQVCRQFPRLRHEYGDFEELGLELSCPEAARLILTAPNQETITESVSGGYRPDYDAEIMATLRKSRAKILSFLDDPHYTVPQALAVMLLYGYEVQTELDGGQAAVLNPSELLADCSQYTGHAHMQPLFDFFKKLEILTDRWKAHLEAGPNPCRWTPIHRALARYFVNRYWLQAVWDYDLVCRVKLTITACLLISAMDGDPVETAQLFSKEIENDPDNVESILDGAYTSPALTDMALLGLLLS
jgi:lysine-N-methylase